jgi:hypothetical protein
MPNYRLFIVPSVKQTRDTPLLESSAIVLQSEAISIEKAIKPQNLIAL